MLKIQNISSEAIQRHSILFNEAEVVFTLRFYPRSQMWCFDAEYGDWSIKGIKLSVGVLHIAGQNQLFDFFVSDLSNNGIDPFAKTDFSSGRCILYLIEQEDIEDIRGVTLS